MQKKTTPQKSALKARTLMYREELYKELEAEAQSQNRSVSNMINEILQDRYKAKK